MANVAGGKWFEGSRCGGRNGENPGAADHAPRNRTAVKIHLQPLPGEFGQSIQIRFDKLLRLWPKSKDSALFDTKGRSWKMTTKSLAGVIRGKGMIMTFDAIQRARELAESDLNGAIVLLSSVHEDHDRQTEFFPDGAFLLARLFHRAQLRDKAIAIVDEIIALDPHCAQIWWFELDLHRFTERYRQACERIYDEIIQLAELPYPDADRTFIEVIFSVLPNDDQAVIDRFLAGGEAKKSKVKTITALVALLKDLKSALDVRRKEFGDIDYWRFSLLGKDQTHEYIDDCFHVNISLLQFVDLAEWDYSLARAFIASVAARLYGSGYWDDEGVSSLERTSYQDKLTAKVWKLLQALMANFGPAVQYEHRLVYPSRLPLRAGELWVRAGNTELWALWSFLDNSAEAIEAAERVAKRAIEASGDAKKFARDDSWWPMTSAENNILILNRNAGWYAKPQFAAASFAHWALLYERGLSRGNIISTYMSEMLTVKTMSEDICRHAIAHWNDDVFETLLDGVNVVFVTAFAKQVQENYDSGRLNLLWKDLGFKARINSLRALPAPMSIFPLYPDDSWSHTFNKLAAACRDSIKETNATVFLASCGAYGIPLVTTVHQEFHIASVYYGHAMNDYFGMLTTHARKFSSFVKRCPQSPHWVDGDLASRVPEINNIPDGWRYL